MLLGLIKPQEGECQVLGFPPGHPKALAQVGAMVETPSLYDHLTGRENAEITRLMKNAARSESERVLSLVGLAQDAKRPVRTYSLGMRQRLGIALALMGSPQLLILDEPTNGLDPVGIQEMRELVRGLPTQTGATVFLSSHILAEVEQIASHVAVIHRGRLKFQGPMEDLGSPEQEELLIRVDDTHGAMRHLTHHGFSPSCIEDDRICVPASHDAGPQVAACIMGAGIGLFELAPRRINLEARFLALLEGA